ncbi:MAG: hypothetical protein J5821_03590 [Alphaproteobacteria bacterium]|nr:hypothetical protein [Alphaproteobacteria bacterium]
MGLKRNDLIPVSCGVVVVLSALLYVYSAYVDHRMIQIDSFIYKGKRVKLIESSYNCGFRHRRMTERCLEMAIAKIWLEKNKEDVIEIGAVSPYYFQNLTHDVCDPADKHERVNLKTSMFNLDLKDKNVLSISTIEHIGMGEYGIPINKNESAVSALKKILRESRKCLITFPVGRNKELDLYVFENTFSKPVTVSFFVRKLNNSFFEGARDNPFKGIEDNLFMETKDINLVKRATYGPVGANAVVVIEKE